MAINVYPESAVMQRGEVLRFSAEGVGPTPRWSLSGRSDTSTTLTNVGNGEADLTIGAAETGELRVICNEHFGTPPDVKVSSGSAKVTVDVPAEAPTAPRHATGMPERLRFQGNWTGLLPALWCLLAGLVVMLILSGFMVSQMQTSQALVSLFPTVEAIEAASHYGFWAGVWPWAFLFGLIFMITVDLISVFSWNRVENEREDIDRQNYRIGRFKMPYVRNAACGIIVALVFGLFWAQKVGDSLLFGYFGEHPYFRAIIIVVILILLIKKLVPWIKKTFSKA